MQLSGINELNFEPKMAVDLASVAATSTPETLRPAIGPLSELNNIPSRARFFCRFSQAATSGNATVNLKTESGQTLKSWAFSLNGTSSFGVDDRVNLSSVAGADNLVFEVNVTAAAQAGTKATFDSVVAVELPLTISGC